MRGSDDEARVAGFVQRLGSRCAQSQVARLATGRFQSGLLTLCKTNVMQRQMDDAEQIKKRGGKKTKDLDLGRVLMLQRLECCCIASFDFPQERQALGRGVRW